MESVFINFSNHPSELWDERQTTEAQKYGRIVDIPFPDVDPQGDENYISKLEREYMNKIMELHPVCVLCQGEFTLTFRLVTDLKNEGITVLAACSYRNVRMNGSRKEVTFQFERFRRY